MNIGLFTDTYFPQISGVSTSTQILAQQLENLGHNVYIFTTTDPKVKRSHYGHGSEKNIYRFSSIPYTGFKDRRITFRGFFEAIEIARTLRLDIIHTQTEFSLGLMGKIIARQLKIPIVHTYHTMYQDYTHYVMNGRLIKAGGVEVIVRAYLKSVNGVIAPSQRVYDTLRGYGVDAPMPIIPTGVSFSKNMPDNSAELRKTLKIRPRQPVILSLGRVAFEKNIEELINVMSYIINDFHNAILVIAGDGPAREELEDHAKVLGLNKHVKFVGMVDHADVYSYYRMADVFASPSTSESQGLTFIEAVNANRPFVAMSNPYLNQITKSKFIGTIVHDNAEMTEAIENYLSDPSFKKENPERDRVLKEISAEKFGADVLKFYQQIINSFDPNGSKSSDEPTDEEIGYARQLLGRLPLPKVAKRKILKVKKEARDNK
ncbi:glycosyltransferase family 4 protein [Oenococcus oeni]|uniref:Glycosyltransferase n=1 Tax=Oenococcus oeni TaxID=1247 RepID=A0AAJ2P2F0_OENOE|nr:glycosyltransferase family 4 protein [Oenococcus oeni]MDV7715584.1 glycosyltransferase [Oenococcus oeni]SYW07588.1 Alpha-monoglucosyldiacylglycerol synthase [Oenococcus oeni]SYW10743.1 Alpha-monoglucosyldiacylglycerol synthase [Oenococcus oeni]SYW16762.1 Alpha-monoglucosyldiacylglycerol synthase [Oenococcus oeni]SYW19822.1 Alpha-monoglucosyldiacylglycerol synthase [Oenococcus oeni]